MSGGGWRYGRGEYEKAESGPRIDIQHSDNKVAEKGYHMKNITRGEYGKLSKVREELEEAEDAVEQDNPILLLCELSDLYGALEAFLAEKFGETTTMNDLKKMSDATKRAFKVGDRQ